MLGWASIISLAVKPCNPADAILSKMHENSMLSYDTTFLSNASLKSKLLVSGRHLIIRTYRHQLPVAGGRTLNSWATRRPHELPYQSG